MVAEGVVVVIVVGRGIRGWGLGLRLRGQGREVRVDEAIRVGALVHGALGGGLGRGRGLEGGWRGYGLEVGRGGAWGEDFMVLLLGFVGCRGPWVPPVGRDDADVDVGLWGWKGEG